MAHQISSPYNSRSSIDIILLQKQPPEYYKWHFVVAEQQYNSMSSIPSYPFIHIRGLVHMEMTAWGCYTQKFEWNLDLALCLQNMLHNMSQIRLSIPHCCAVSSTRTCATINRTPQKATLLTHTSQDSTWWVFVPKDAYTHTPYPIPRTSTEALDTPEYPALSL